MKPRKITQTRVGMPWGNCWHACIAGLVGAELAEVPDPRTAWLAEGVSDEEALEWMKSAPFMRSVGPWLRDRGVGLVVFGGDGRRLLRNVWGAPFAGPLYWIAGGLNSAGVGHAVIYRNDELWWDPNPSRAGLAEIEDFTLLLIHHEEPPCSP